jgi:hypothetical protein
MQDDMVGGLVNLWLFRQYRLIVDGVATAPLSGHDRQYIPVHGHIADDPKGMLPRIEASVLTPCGWLPGEVEVQPLSKGEIEQAHREKRTPVVAVTVYFNPPSYNGGQLLVLVDNRGQPAARIAVGEIEESVAAGGSEKTYFPYWPNCEEARHLHLNGETLGRIEEDAQHPEMPLPMLLDTSGSHCFRWEYETYSNHPSFSSPTAPKTYKAQRLHLLQDDVDYFLESLPFEVYSPGGFETGKSSLTETKCK